MTRSPHRLPLGQETRTALLAFALGVSAALYAISPGGNLVASFGGAHLVAEDCHEACKGPKVTQADGMIWPKTPARIGHDL